MNKKALTLQKLIREKFARQLHDGPAQTTSAVAMRSSLLRKQREEGDVSLAELEALEVLARQAAQELRQELFWVRPMILEAEGLARSMQDLLRIEKETNDNGASLTVEGENWKRLSQEKAEPLFYVAGEAIRNARKDEKANDIKLKLFEDEEKAVLEIIGNEDGFAAGEDDEKGASGFSLMKLWLEEVGGGLNVEGADRGHEKLIAWVPRDG